MSVAFRRESDEEHKEPRFELPLPPGPNLVTPRGLRLIEARVAELEGALDAGGDAEVESIRRDLRYWHTRRTTAQVTPPPDDGSVGFATRVAFTLAGRRRSIDIVGEDEAEPARDRIGLAAPLAQAMLGAEPGDRLAFNGRDDAIEIIAVEPLKEDEE